MYTPRPLYRRGQSFMDHPKFIYWNSKVNGMELLGGPLEDRSQGLQPHRWNWCLTNRLNVINLLPPCTLLCKSVRRPPPDTKCWHPDHGIQNVRNNVVYGLPSLRYMVMLIYLPDMPHKSLDIPLNSRTEEFSRNRTSLDWFTLLSTLQPLKFSHLSQRHSLLPLPLGTEQLCVSLLFSHACSIHHNFNLFSSRSLRTWTSHSTPVCPQEHREFCAPSKGLLHKHFAWESFWLSHPLWDYSPP